MSLKVRTPIAWIAVAVLLAASAWSFNIALYNWWAADTVRNENHRVYVFRENLFSIVTLALILISGTLLTVMLRHRRTKTDRN